MLSRNGTVGQTNHMLAEMHVALLLGQKSKEVVSPVFQCGARTGLFLFWVLDVCIYNVWALWALPSGHCVCLDSRCAAACAALGLPSEAGRCPHPAGAMHAIPGQQARRVF